MEEKKKQKFKIKRSFVGKPEDYDRIISVTLRLIHLHEEKPVQKEKAA